MRVDYALCYVNITLSRRKNILLFNLSELTSLSNDSIEDDLTTITKILEFLGLQIKPTSISRLGSRSSTASKPRPIKLSLSDQKEVFSIFAAQNKLKTHQVLTNLRFSSDRTKTQRDFMIQYGMNSFAAEKMVNQI
jgi:hypothetical protein